MLDNRGYSFIFSHDTKNLAMFQSFVSPKIKTMRNFDIENGLLQCEFVCGGATPLRLRTLNLLVVRLKPFLHWFCIG